MSEDQDRSPIWDRANAADVLFGPEGGMAIFVRTGDVGAVGAMRGMDSSDVMANAINVACVSITLEDMTTAIATALKIEPEEFREIVAVARRELKQRVSLCARLKKAETP